MHSLADRRPSPTRRGYGSQWAKLSRQARALQPYCSQCGTDYDLTADHLWPGKIARDLGDVIVLCRSCNARKGKPGGYPLDGLPEYPGPTPNGDYSAGRP